MAAKLKTNRLVNLSAYTDLWSKIVPVEETPDTNQFYAVLGYPENDAFIESVDILEYVQKKFPSNDKVVVTEHSTSEGYRWFLVQIETFNPFNLTDFKL